MRRHREITVNVRRFFGRELARHPGTGYLSNVPIFTRILDFKRVFLTRLRNKRRHPRHRVGAGFALKASLNLSGSGKLNPDKAAVRGSGVNWGGAVGDISASGLNIILSPAATTARGEPSVLRLTLEKHEIVIPCTIAHFRVNSSHALCGVHLEFDDFKPQKAYLQIVEAVKLGSSFEATGPGRKQAGFVSRSWHSVQKAHLTDWREADSLALDHFELSFGEYKVLGWKARPGLEVCHRKDAAKSVPPAVEAEVRQMYSWIVGNLPKNVPADLRTLMSRSGGTPFAAPAPSAKLAPGKPAALTSTVVTTPPSAWQAPKAGAEVNTGA